MNVLRVPTRYRKQLSRLKPEKRLWVFDSLMTISSGEDVCVPDAMEGDIFELIFRDMLMMENRNKSKEGTIVGKALPYAPSGSPGTTLPGDPEPEVKGSEVKRSEVKGNELNCVEPPVRKKKANKKKIFQEGSEAFRLSKLLYQKCLENNPIFREPNLQSWAMDMDLLLRVDKYPFELIEVVIVWCQRDNFWKANILSVSKLRKQFNQLVLKAKEHHQSGGVAVYPG